MTATSISNTVEITYVTPNGGLFVLRYAVGEDIPDTVTIDSDGPGGKEPVTATRRVQG